jgi:Rrf2 family protein
MITRTGLHAVRALAALARLPAGAHAGAAALAGEIGAPANYLGKLLQTLAREGVVKSQKGLGGGFRLARDPRDISLFEVVEPFEHVSRWAGCVLGRPECSDRNPCALHDRWKRVRDAYLRMLHRTTIAQILAAGEPSGVPA